MRRLLLPLLAASLLIAAETRAWGANDTAGELKLPARKPEAALTRERSGAAAHSASRSDSIWKTAGALLFVVALVVVVAKVVRKGMPAANASLPAEVVQVLGHKPLDYRHTLHLVRCGPKLLVLGSSADGLRPLMELADPAEVERLTSLCQPGESHSVADAVGQALRRFRGTDEPPAEADEAPALDEVLAQDEEPREDHAALRLRTRLNWTAAHPEEPAGPDAGEAAA